MFSSVKSFGVVVNRKNNDQNCPFRPGDVFDGHVELCLKNDLQVTDIQLKISGAAKVVFKKWYHSFWDREKEEETLLDHRESLLEKGESQVSMVTKGTHSYPFKFKLPKNLPSSFRFYKGTVFEWNSNVNGGEVSYFATASIKVKTRFGEKEIHTDPKTFQFDIKRPFILDKRPELFKPAESTADGHIPFFCSGGEIKLQCQLEKTAFTEGEPIPVAITVDNLSRRTVTSVKLVLEKRYYFKYYKHTKLKTGKMLNKVVVPLQVPGGETASTSNRELYIPPVTEHSKLKGIDNMDVRYRVVGTISMFAQDPITSMVSISVGERASDRAL